MSESQDSPTLPGEPGGEMKTATKRTHATLDEREAQQETQLGVRQAEIAFDVIAQDRKDQAIHDAEHLDEEQDDDHPA